MTAEARENPLVRPMLFWRSLLHFAVPGLVVFIFVWVGIPALVSIGLSPFAAYLWALLLPLVLMTIAALVSLRREGWALNRASLRDRYRFKRMTGKHWLWTIGGVLVAYLLTGALQVVNGMLLDIGLYGVPDSVPLALSPFVTNPIEAFDASIGGSIVGRWDLAALYFVLLFFNITGEELWWRGYILPRQELAFDNKVWWIHGLMWAGFHFFKWWDVLTLIPVTLILTYVCWRNKTNTPGYVIHLIFNGIGFLGFLALVAGFGPG